MKRLPLQFVVLVSSPPFGDVKSIKMLTSSSASQQTHLAALALQTKQILHFHCSDTQTAFKTMYEKNKSLKTSHQFLCVILTV